MWRGATEGASPVAKFGSRVWKGFFDPGSERTRGLKGTFHPWGENAPGGDGTLP